MRTITGMCGRTVTGSPISNGETVKVLSQIVRTPSTTENVEEDAWYTSHYRRHMRIEDVHIEFIEENFTDSCKEIILIICRINDKVV